MILLTENSSVATNDTQGPEKSPRHWKSCRDTLLCVNMSIKLPQHFYMLMKKPLSYYLQVRSPYYQAAQWNQNTYFRILSVTDQVWECQKSISINTNHCYHQLSSPWANLNWSKNKVRFTFKYPNRTRWCTRLVDAVKHLCHKVFLLRHHY